MWQQIETTERRKEIHVDQRYEHNGMSTIQETLLAMTFCENDIFTRVVF